MPIRVKKEFVDVYLGYFDVFPEKVKTELRTATFEKGGAHDPLPSGTFLFTEYFCTNPRCDCQRVLVKVFRMKSESARPEEVATISYSWNPNSDHLWQVVHAGMPNPFLDPLHRQAHYASEVLDFWYAMLNRDRLYAKRLQRHYDEIRTEVGQKSETLDRRRATNRNARTPSDARLAKRAKKLRKKRAAHARKRR